MVSNDTVSEMKELELWLPVINWPKYLVSNFGRVTRNGKLLSLFPIIGYPSFNVISGTKRKSLRVHREVLRAFVGISPAGFHARHKDGNPSNCKLDNLEWGTGKENEHDKIKHGRIPYGDKNGSRKFPERLKRGSSNSNSKLTESKVRDARIRALKGESVHDMSIEFGVSVRGLYYAVERKTWRHVY